jgi:hypothetical protein
MIVMGELWSSPSLVFISSSSLALDIRCNRLASCQYTRLDRYNDLPIIWHIVGKVCLC